MSQRNDTNPGCTAQDDPNQPNANMKQAVPDNRDPDDLLEKAKVRGASVSHGGLFAQMECDEHEALLGLAVNLFAVALERIVKERDEATRTVVAYQRENAQLRERIAECENASTSDRDSPNAPSLSDGVFEIHREDDQSTYRAMTLREEDAGTMKKILRALQGRAEADKLTRTIIWLQELLHQNSTLLATQQEMVTSTIKQVSEQMAALRFLQQALTMFFEQTGIGSRLFYESLLVAKHLIGGASQREAEQQAHHDIDGASIAVIHEHIIQSGVLNELEKRHSLSEFGAIPMAGKPRIFLHVLALMMATAASQKKEREPETVPSGIAIPAPFPWKPPDVGSFPPLSTIPNTGRR